MLSCHVHEGVASKQDQDISLFGGDWNNCTQTSIHEGLCARTFQVNLVSSDPIIVIFLVDIEDFESERVVCAHILPLLNDFNRLIDGDLGVPILQRKSARDVDIAVEVRVGLVEPRLFKISDNSK